MNPETKQIFNAPWQVQYDGESEDMWITDASGTTIADIPDTPGLEKYANQMALVPDLYDALAEAIREACIDCVAETELRTGMLFDTVQDGCIYPERDCCETCRGWMALLQKVKQANDR